MFICKFPIRILLGILVIFVVRGNASPISPFTPGKSELAPSSDSTPASMMDSSSSFFPEHRRDLSMREIATGVNLPPPHSPEDDKVDAISTPETAHAYNRGFIRAHPALVIGLCMLALLVLCVSIYLIVRYCRNKRRTSEDVTEAASDATADLSFEDKSLETPTPGEKNVIHGESLPECPRLIYVPPNAESGAQTLFGHFMSPCGRVVGVKDTWTLAGSRTAANNA